MKLFSLLTLACIANAASIDHANKDIHSEIAKHLTYNQLLQYRQLSSAARQGVDYSLCQIDDFKFFRKAVHHNDVAAMQRCFDAFIGHPELISV